MKNVVMNLQNPLYAEVVERSLREDGDFAIRNVSKPETVIRQCQLMSPDILLLEITPYPSWELSERRRIWEEVRRQLPQCRIVLMVDDQTEENLADRLMLLSSVRYPFPT